MADPAPSAPVPYLQPQMRSPDGAISFATQAASTAYNYMAQLGVVTSGLVPPSITPVFSTPGNAPTPITATLPTLQQVTVNAQNKPDTLSATLNVDAMLPEPFDSSPPTLMFGSAPAPISEPVPVAPGVDTSYVMPTLNLSLPTAPGLLTLNIAQFDGVTLPTIDEHVTELTAVAPTTVNYQPGQYYTSALLDVLKNTLASRIANGGTGLPAEAENAIWDRQRERELIASDDAIRDLDRMETLGYALPPGVYIDARLRVNTEMRARHMSLGREIMIKQAELEMENIRQSLGIAVQLEQTLTNYNNQVEQRLFESCKYATQAGIEIYNAKVKAYAAYLETYKTKVAIYEARIRGEMAKVEIYKAQIQAEEAKAQVNTALIQQYKVQTDAALAGVEVFKAQVMSIQSKAELEKLKISIFGEQVRAYTAKIGAYTAGVEGFRASVQAESAKQEAFKSQVSVYTARVDAAVKAIEAKIEEYKGRVMAKTAEWEGYKAAVQGESARAQAITASNQTLVEGYKAEVAGVTGYNETLTKQWQVSYEQAQRTAEIAVAAAKANGELYMTTRSLSLDAAKVGAQVSAQIAAASLNAVNYSYSNTFGYSASASNSSSNSFVQSLSNAYSNAYATSTSYQNSNSTSNSQSLSHNYNYSASV